MKKCDERVALRVSRVSIGVNLLLSALKFMAGLLAHSGAMLSDAVHSASDVLSTLVGMVGVRLAGKEPDWDHPYGHERLERDVYKRQYEGVSPSVIRRLPRYYRFLEDLQKKDVHRISSR